MLTLMIHTAAHSKVNQVKVRRSRGSDRHPDAPPAMITDQIQPTTGCRTTTEMIIKAA